jgi:hypothetical protein
VTFSVVSTTDPNANLVSVGLTIRHVLQGTSAYGDVRGRLVHLVGVTAYEIHYLYRSGSSVFRAVKYVVGKANVVEVITYEALLKDAAAVANAFARSASSVRWLRGPYDLDIRAITVTRTRRNGLQFVVRFRHPASLTKRTDLQLLLDTDQNARTGVQWG